MFRRIYFGHRVELPGLRETCADWLAQALCIVCIASCLGRVAAREEHGAREFLLAGTAVAAVTASFGCTLGGAAGVVGMALGTVAAGAPVWLAARAHR